MEAQQYLLDTNICVFLLHGRTEVIEKIREVGWQNCHIAEMTVAELLCGVRNDGRRARNIDVVNAFVDSIDVVPTSKAIREFAKQKIRLESLGTKIEDMDLFIGATSVAKKYIMVSENTKHLNRIEGIILENWIIRK